MDVKYRSHSPHSQTEQEVQAQAQAQAVGHLLEVDHKDNHPTWCYSRPKGENMDIL